MTVPDTAVVPDEASILAPIPVRTPRGRFATFTALWLVSALGVGAGTGFGILALTDHSAVAKPAAAPAVVPQPTPTPAVTSGVRSDGTHYGSVLDFLLPAPGGFHPGPDDEDFGNDAAITPQQLDAQVSGLFSGLQQSDLTSAKGSMEAAHMKGGALRTYTSDDDNLNVELIALQLDPSMAAKSTADFTRIVKLSSRYRSGPAVAGHPDAQCVLPPTWPGDKIDTMICLGTVGDTFVIATATGTVPMDQDAITRLFAKQLDQLKNGPVAK